MELTDQRPRRSRGLSQPAQADLDLPHQLLVSYSQVLSDAVTVVRNDLGVSPTSRMKNTGTILEKLERYGGSWLKSVQDLAGMRIVGSFDRIGQDTLVERLVDLVSGDRRAPKVVDRRQVPMHGYAAVHVIVFPGDVPIEIQVRTRWQHEWADLFEKLADRVGRGIRCQAASTSSRRANVDPVFVIDPCRELSPDWCSAGVNPSHALSAVACSKRCQSPLSSRCNANAVRVSIPRKHLSLATVGHHCSSSARRESRSAIAALRALMPSVAAIKSANTSSLAGSSNC